MGNHRFALTQDSRYGTLVYSLQPDEKLLRFDHCMMINNNIDGVLSYSVETGSDSVSLAYNIIRGTRLSLLKSRILSGKNLISILLAIANVLISSEQYMLIENRFVFSEDCIFADASLSSVNLVYIPTTGYSGISFAQFVRYFITNGAFDYGEDAGRIMSLLNYVNTNPNAPADEIKAVLERTAPSHAAAVQPSVNREEPARQKAVPPVQQQPVQPAPQPVPAPQPSHEKNGLLSKVFGGHKSKSEPAPGGAVAEMNIPGQPAPGGAMAGMNIPGQSAPGGVMAGMNIPGQPAPQRSVSANKQEKKLFRKEAVPAAAVAVAPPAARPVNNVPEIAADFANQSQETVLLNQGNYAAGNSKRAYLIGTNGERVAVTASGFTVGKENTSGITNDYMINNASVSRNHAMFEIKDGRYFVVDMTSLNGTFVNGNRISSNIRVEIKNGDRIVFANAEYKFVVE